MQDESRVAGNGLLSRRHLMRLGGAAAGAVVVPVRQRTWLPSPGAPDRGAPPSAYGRRSRFAELERERVGGHPFGPAAGSASTPLQALNGVITPNSLHFERHHSGIPDIDPGVHRLTIAGRVRVPLSFGLNALLRYPMQSRILFLECSGNSYLNTMGDAQDLTAGTLSGLVSCAEWTGVPLSSLLEETGLGPDARWIVAEGADPSGNKRSLPIDLALDGAMIALYQNGEPIRPARASRCACSCPAARAISA